MKAYCLFEQSGTFKNEFKKLGIEAYDFDIQNKFGETDFTEDLFYEIEEAYEGRPSIFDGITSNDIIMAFFPCIRFTIQTQLTFRCDTPQLKKWDNVSQLEYNMKLHKELAHNYELISKFAIVCLKRKLKVIIENPYQKSHYLSNYWALKPAFIDYDRTLRGDQMKKPTQYWFINCKPKCNVVDEEIIPCEVILKEKTFHNFKGL